MTFTVTPLTSCTYVYIHVSHVYKLACTLHRTINLLPLFCSVLPHPTLCFILHILGKRVKLGEVDLIPFVPFVGVNRHHAIPLNRPINGIVTPGLERIQDVKTLAYLAAPVAYGLHSFALVFVDGFSFALDD
jgi:hypothetical protein